MLSTTDLHRDNVSCPPTHQHTPREVPTYTENPDHTFSLVWMKSKTDTEAIGVKIVGGRAYGKATGLNIKHCRYTELWNRWYPVRSAHDFLRAQLFTQQMTGWLAQQPRGGQENFIPGSFYQADSLLMLHSELLLGMGLGNPPVVRVWPAKMGRFSSRLVQKPNPLSLGGPNPDLHPSTHGLCRISLGPLVPMSSCAFRVFLFMVAFSYPTVQCKILTLVYHWLFEMYWLPLYSK